ncbi:hypothetical protein C942_01353 [Photobacterium marinum]|uniref:Uncharacterized protein n=1 Tax=Photobacterium marinum TaxID=1056511 RepID=L8JIV1_9GAMM|nr:hypothetical protein C942_01353 [Photobacterium marinum]
MFGCMPGSLFCRWFLIKQRRLFGITQEKILAAFALLI